MNNNVNYQKKVDHRSTNNNFGNHNSNTRVVLEKEVPKTAPFGLDSSVSSKFKKKLLVLETLTNYQQENVKSEVARHMDRASVRIH